MLLATTGTSAVVAVRVGAAGVVIAASSAEAGDGSTEVLGGLAFFTALNTGLTSIFSAASAAGVATRVAAAVPDFSPAVLFLARCLGVA